MSSLARSGVLVYAKDLARLSAFYRDVLGGRVIVEDADHHVIVTPDQQLVVHAMPPVIAETVSVARPPVLREEAAFKPFFTVASLAASREAAHQRGGGVFEEEWQEPGVLVRHAFDCEGNVFQLREQTA